MPRNTKAKTTTADESTPVVQVVAAAPVVVAETPKVKKVSAPKVKKEAAPVVEVAAPVVAAASEESAAPVVDVEATLAEQSLEFSAKLQQLSVVISSLKSEYKLLEKKWSRELKNSMKTNSKRKRKAGNRAPSGFVKPTRISDELATFLGKSSGSEMARTEVTRDINQYIRANSLQDTTNGRKINPDSKLASLLKIKKGEELTYFNLQRYMSPHFAKSDKSVAAAAAAAAASSTA
jgi:upstream activation factor subunit UAF30